MPSLAFWGGGGGRSRKAAPFLWQFGRASPVVNGVKRPRDIATLQRVQGPLHIGPEGLCTPSDISKKTRPYCMKGDHKQLAIRCFPTLGSIISAYYASLIILLIRELGTPRVSRLSFFPYVLITPRPDDVQTRIPPMLCPCMLAASTHAPPSQGR
jgi:hypothetical protein